MSVALGETSCYGKAMSGWPNLSDLLVSADVDAPVGLVGAPLGVGSVTLGRCDEAPALLRKTLRRIGLYDIETGREIGTRIADHGDAQIAGLSIEQATDPIRDAVEASAARHELTLLVGGNNAITRPAVLGLAMPLEKVGLITLDAHFDMRDLADGLSNGNPVRALIEDGLPGANIAQVGLASFANSAKMHCDAIDAGNLVSGGGGAAATLLTTINAVDPLYFEFSGSEALYLKSQREGLGKNAKVDIRLADEPDYRWHGTLDFTDNGLDPASGTIRARAVVPNAGDILTPGLFGRMRLATGGTRSALLVPDTAIVTDQTRKQVLVVGRDGTVAARTVEPGPLVGGLRVIESGLRPGDKVIVKGVQMAMPGQKVRPQPGKIVPAKAAPAASEEAARPVSRAASATFAN